MTPSLPPRAYPRLRLNGVIRNSVDDFVVDEIALPQPQADGEHLYVSIEKRGMNTRAVAADLARHFDVPELDVSFAGMKDRHAVTRQWFSIRTPRDLSDGTAGEGWRVLAAHRAPRKLRRGDLAGNTFCIRIVAVRGDTETLQQRLALVARQGVPNYFGEQRFGHNGANIERARAWVCRRPRAPVNAFVRGLHLSTARALLFNAVLGLRVAEGTWRAVLDGEAVVDASPTGPLWGRGRPAATGAAAAAEARALEPHQPWLDPLEHLGLTQARRALVARPEGFRATLEADSLVLNFALPAGQFATAVLREFGDLCNAATGNTREAAEATRVTPRQELA